MLLRTRSANAAAAGLLLSVVSFVASASPVWFVDNKALYRLDPATQQIALTVKTDDVRSLAVNSDGSVWALSKKRLTKYQVNGAVATDIELKALSLKSADHTALDSRDGSLWVAEGKEDDENEDDDGDGHAKRIIRLNDSGQRVQDFTSPGRVRAMVLGLDQSIWLLGNKSLWHYSRAGERLDSVDLKPISKEKPKLLALDALGVWLWMGTDKQLIRVDGDTPAAAPIKRDLTRKVELLVIDPRSGDLWAATEQSLLLYSDSATPTKVIDLKALGLKDPNSLAFDSANQALWLGHDKGLTRFATDGTRVVTIAAKDDIDAIGVAPFSLVPTIDILAPTADPVTNDPLPVLRVKAGAQCNAAPCAFSVDYFDSYRLSAKLDGLEIGNLFTRGPGTAESTHRPTAKLADGAHVFLAEATDSFGQVSAARETRFSVDTTPPRFGAISPADGSLFKSPKLTLTGSVDETAGLRLEGPGTSLSANGTSFSFPISLNEGLNRFAVRATDAAGNTADQPLGYTLDSIAPKFLTIAPADGTMSSMPNVSISGSVDEHARIQLSGEGVLQSVEGASFSFPVVLKAGVNSYALMATDKAGNQTPATVKLSLQSAALKFATLSPADGTFFAGAKTTIAGSFAEQANFKLTGEGLALTARGVRFSFPVTLKPGANSFHVTATNPAGNMAQADLNLTLAPVTITVSSPVDITTTTDDSVTVAGTISGPPGTTVTVNDEIVALANWGFSVAVPLSPGPNVINVMAIAPLRDGVASNTIIIERRSVTPEIVIAFDAPMDGAVFIAPATIQVKAQARRPDGSTVSGLKISNDSPVGFQNGVGESGYAEYEWRDVPEGTYEITASITDENGTVITKSVTVRVEADPLDKPFMAIWNGFKVALLAGNKSAALEYVAMGSRDRYDRVFNELMPAMAEVFDSLYRMQRTSLDEDVAEYFINQLEDSSNRELGFFIYFVRDGDGIWRISTL